MNLKSDLRATILLRLETYAALFVSNFPPHRICRHVCVEEMLEMRNSLWITRFASHRRAQTGIEPVIISYQKILFSNGTGHFRPCHAIPEEKSFQVVLFIFKTFRKKTFH